MAVDTLAASSEATIQLLKEKHPVTYHHSLGVDILVKDYLDRDFIRKNLQGVTH